MRTLSRLEKMYNLRASGNPSSWMGPVWGDGDEDAKLAAELGIDNRIMYTVGAAAKALNLLDSDLIMGIPLSVTGKNPFFDRPAL